MRKILLILMLVIASCQQETILNSEPMALALTQGFANEDYLAGQSPNILIFDGVTDYLDIIWGYPFTSIQPWSSRYVPIGGQVIIDMLEITKMMYLYDNDIFDYSKSETYGTGDGYHIEWLSMNASDNSISPAIIQGAYVINAALQIGDPTEMGDYLDEILSEGMIEMPVWTTPSLYYPKSVSKLTDILHPEILRVVDTGSLSSEEIEVDGCGADIKWLNQKGNYAYWYFDGKHVENPRLKSLGSVVDYWTDRATAQGSRKYLGYEDDRNKTLLSNVDNRYIEEFMTLFSSPEIYIYTGDLTTHSWLRLGMAKGSAPIIIGATYTKARIELELPERYTITK